MITDTASTKKSKRARQSRLDNTDRRNLAKFLMRPEIRSQFELKDFAQADACVKLKELAKKAYEGGDESCSWWNRITPSHMRAYYSKSGAAKLPKGGKITYSFVTDARRKSIDEIARKRTETQRANKRLPKLNELNGSRGRFFPEQETVREEIPQADQTRIEETPKVETRDTPPESERLKTKFDPLGDPNIVRIDLGNLEEPFKKLLEGLVDLKEPLKRFLLDRGSGCPMKERVEGRPPYWPWPRPW